jgi:Ca2+-binding RTX toxin-like protein
MAVVTVQGSHSQNVPLQYDSTSNTAIASQIAGLISTGITNGTLTGFMDTGGTIPTVPAGVGGVLIQQTGLAALPPGYVFDIVTDPVNSVVFGNGAPSLGILSDANVDLTFIASSGSGTVAAGGGDNRISVGGSGSWMLYTGSGNDVITAAASVTATIGAGGGDNTILLGNGNDLIQSTGSDTIIGASGAETVDATNATKDFVVGNQSDLLFVGGTGGATILGGSGSDTYFGSPRPSGDQLIVGGTAGNNYLFAGDGAATLVGGGSGDQLFAYGANAQTLIAGKGTETLSAAASSGSDLLKSGPGQDLLIGGTGSDTYVGSSGNTTVQAGLGKQTFDFINFHTGGGTELVTGMFDSSLINIHLTGYAPGQVEASLQSATVQNNAITIGLEDGTKITFQDVTSLSKANFS